MVESLAFTLMFSWGFSPQTVNAVPHLQGHLFSLQTPHLSTCRWSHSQCWRTTWSRFTALQRPTLPSPSTGKSPAGEAHTVVPCTRLLVTGASPVVLGIRHGAWSTVGVLSTPVHPWPGGLLLSFMSTHSPPLRQKISLLLFEQLVYPLFLKGGKEAQGRKAETAMRTSMINQHLDSSPVLTKSFSWGRWVPGAASPERRAPGIRHTHRPCAALAHHTDESIPSLCMPVFPC